jgi:NADH-quinone oxidoreductase subunit C
VGVENDSKPTKPEAAADKPPSEAPAEPLKGEVSRTDSPGAGVTAAPSAAPVKPPAAPAKPPAASTAKPAAGPAPKAAAEHKPGPPAAPTGPSDPPPPPDKAIPEFVSALQSRLPGAVEQIGYFVGDWWVIVPVERLLDVMRSLRDSPEAAFDFCSDVTASDWPPRPKRFDVVYCLYSTRHRHRLRVKVRAGEHDPVPSVTTLWPSANWLEREVYDLFGVNFTGHPDRRRILMPEDWQGFPQRKDYPLEGPGELLLENPLDWLRVRQARDELEIE